MRASEPTEAPAPWKPDPDFRTWLRSLPLPIGTAVVTVAIFVVALGLFYLLHETATVPREGLSHCLTQAGTDGAAIARCRHPSIPRYARQPVASALVSALGSAPLVWLWLRPYHPRP